MLGNSPSTPANSPFHHPEASSFITFTLSPFFMFKCVLSSLWKSNSATAYCSVAEEEEEEEEVEEEGEESEEERSST